MKSSKPRVYIAMSGGVDSSVSAALLKKDGFDVRGVFMHCWDENDPVCTIKQDKKDALRVAAYLNISIQTWDFKEEYANKVYNEFIKSYNLGITPNPDILCNLEIKFGMFYRLVKEKDPNAKIATGHYARILNIGGQSFLRVSKDSKKDQSYFLYLVNSDKLSNIIFPIGNLTKDKVRQLAVRYVPQVKDKADSQGVCFIGRTNLSKILNKHVGTCIGTAINLNGKVIGTVTSVKTATIGQRHGFMICSDINFPYYVIDKDVKKRVLIVDEKRYAFSNEFMIKNLYKPNSLPFDFTKKLYVRIRHLGKLTLVKIFTHKKSVYVKLNTPEFGLAPGQHAVFYDQKGVVRAGGEIYKVNTKYKKRFSLPL